MTQRLQMTVREVYAPDCSADLGDARCGVDLAVLEESGTVDAVISATAFETTLAQATGWYDGGELIWTGGANAGQTVAVRRLARRDGNAHAVPGGALPDAGGRRLHDPPRLRQELRDLPGEVRQCGQLPRLPTRPRTDRVLSYPDAQS